MHGPKINGVFGSRRPCVIVLSRVQTVIVTARLWPCKRWFPIKASRFRLVSPPSTPIQYPLVPLSLSNMSSPFLSMITPEIPFSWVNNTLFDEEGYAAPRFKSVGYAQPSMIPEPVLTDLVSLVSPLAYKLLTFLCHRASTTQVTLATCPVAASLSLASMPLMPQYRSRAYTDQTSRSTSLGWKL